MNTRTRSRAGILAAVAVAISNCGVALYGQQTRSASPSSASESSQGQVHLAYSQFQIPFNVDSSGTPPSAVQLLVSTDEGSTWQIHGRATPRDRHFDFRAAAEGDYLFKVQTLDATGVAFPSPTPPLRIRIDTSKPQAVIQADLDHAGKLIVDLRVFDDNLDLNSAIIRLRTDRNSQWSEVPVTTLSPVGQYFEGQVEILVPQCHEVAIVFSISDKAKNSGEASLLFPMPRTAASPSDMQLASTSQGAVTAQIPGVASGPINQAGPRTQVPGAVTWDLNYGQGAPSALRPEAAPDSTAGDPDRSAKSSTTLVHSTQLGNFPTSPRIVRPTDKVGPEKNTGPGMLAGANVELELGPPIESAPEAIVKPEPLSEQNLDQSNSGQSEPMAQAPKGTTDSIAENHAGNPYYCRSRAFSLDYSVESLGGNALSEVELWGTEDHGGTWQKWGSDPDRVSPFDVKVGNDGLFGFRMVLVGAGGVVLGSPKPGEDADAWIQIDTVVPSCKITRALYGVGSEAGMLVIDYICSDSDLPEQAISLSWSASPEGPWTSVASGLENTGLYLWKADPGLPARVYLKLDAVDRAGNIGTYRLDLPIDTKGLAPRGRIQGIRPIVSSQ